MCDWALATSNTKVLTAQEWLQTFIYKSLSDFIFTYLNWIKSFWHVVTTILMTLIIILKLLLVTVCRKKWLWERVKLRFKWLSIFCCSLMIKKMLLLICVFFSSYPVLYVTIVFRSSWFSLYSHLLSLLCNLHFDRFPAH